MRIKETPTEVDSPLVDTTVVIPLHSKRTERRQKRRQEKEKARRNTSLLDLPSELIIEVLGYLKPTEVLTLLRVSRYSKHFILQHEARIANEIIESRYKALAKCFQLPILLDNVDESARHALQDEERQILLNIHKKPYQHVKSPDPQVICTCITCVLAWNNLCVVVDFAGWQNKLDHGEPIPIIPRGKSPAWNQNLIFKNGANVERAFHCRLWYARLLEEHLRSTIRSIRRQRANKGNRRSRFRMSEEDAASGTDLFLERSGPPSTEFPFHRDSYYMLEAYLPNRGWNGEKLRWMYMPPSQHDRDLEFVKAWAVRKKHTDHIFIKG